jgi:arylsulfatase A-like enzyme
MFINYMDAHFPYNPDDEFARLFLDEEALRNSYPLKLRFPPVEFALDVSKGGYTPEDLEIIKGLYDADIRYLDGELRSLVQGFKDADIYDDTATIITSDHGEYLGTRNRLAHGLGLHEEVLHVPLLVRYPAVFEHAVRYETVVTHVDVVEAILSLAGIEERPDAMPETQELCAVRSEERPNVFAEVRYPLHLLVNASLREDHSELLVEQKTIRSRRYQLIWKSRGVPEFYHVSEDPMGERDLYSPDDPQAERMQEELVRWADSDVYDRGLDRDDAGVSEREAQELVDRLRAMGYVK